MNRMVTSIVVLLTIGCGVDPSEPAVSTQSSVACATSDNDAIRLGLARSCAPCHGTGKSRPFFASLAAFEDLLAYDARFVTPGDPDSSELIRLLEGESEGAYPQMPTVGAAFATRAERGETDITMAEIRTWISTLPERAPGSAHSDVNARSTRRLTAHEFIRAIQLALGQEPSGAHHPVLQTEGRPPLDSDSNTLRPDYLNPPREQIYAMLGGPSYLRQRRPETDWSPSSLIVATQLAQGACSRAVRSSNEQIYRYASRADMLPEQEDAIRRNIAHLYQRFLHEPPSEETVETLLTEVYAPGEAVDPTTGWIHVCTALMRDPLFLTF